MQRLFVSRFYIPLFFSLLERFYLSIFIAGSVFYCKICNMLS
jgi:hypothetical protein